MRSFARTQRPPQETALSLWLRSRGLTYAQAADLIGCTPEILAMWARGQTIPSLVYAFKVERATQGGVPVASWLGTDIGVAQWHRRGRQKKEQQDG